MSLYFKYYKDVMCEVDTVFSYEHQEDVPVSLVIYMLNNIGKPLYDKNVVIVIDWDTPQPLVDLTYEILEDGNIT